jgi:hypothetical protein
VKAAQKLLGALTFGGGGEPGQGVVVERVKGGKLAPTLAEIHKNGAENGRFPPPIDF